MGAVLFKYPSGQCSKIFRGNSTNIREDRQACYGGFPDSSIGTSGGDWGGPIVSPRNAWEDACLLGISSYSQPSSRERGSPSIFTKAEFYSEWIKTVIRTLSADKKLSGCSIQ